jgi:hypothetical protein
VCCANEFHSLSSNSLSLSPKAEKSKIENKKRRSDKSLFENSEDPHPNPSPKGRRARRKAVSETLAQRSAWERAG